MVAKIMPQQEFCQECSRKHNCHQIYQQLCKTKVPSVASKIVLAFLLPLIVFIVTLAASEGILTNSINTKGLQTVISFLLALSVTFILILVIKAKKSKRQTKAHNLKA